MQPLVENAVRHGLAGKEGIGRLTITAADRGPDAEISIEDDGIGADPQRIRTILDGARHRLGRPRQRRCPSTFQVYSDSFGLVVETAPERGGFRVPKFAPGIHADG